MMTRLSHTFLNAVQRLADAPEHTLSKVAARFNVALRPDSGTGPTPDHVMNRLESVFEALSELSFQPHLAAAFDLACDTLQAELPAEAVAAGLYDIDRDEIRFVVARGVNSDQLRNSAIPRTRCLAGHTAAAAVILRGETSGAGWLGAGADGSSVLLCPIVRDAHLLGVIALADPLCAAQFSDHDLELVAYVADQLATVIQNHRHRATTLAPHAAPRD